MKGRKRLPPCPPGTRFGKWTIIELIGYGPYGAIYKCVCDCGKEKDHKGDRLRNLRTSSCRKCAISERRKTIKL